MKRRIYIAQLLLAQSEASSVTHVSDSEDGSIFKVTKKSGGTVTVRVTPGGSISVKKGEDWEVLDVSVPYSITEMEEGKKKAQSIVGWLSDSKAFREQSA